VPNGAKMKREINYTYPLEQDDLETMVLEEPSVLYETDVTFSMQRFHELETKLGFSQAEWSEILHLSLRTLQRYLKDSSPFEGLQAELLYQIKRLTDAGLLQFSSPEGFVRWIRTEKEVLGKRLGFTSLKSITGVRLLRDELARMAEGVYI
jgi:DNA-binding transcriptional regulator YiaG